MKKIIFGAILLFLVCLLSCNNRQTKSLGNNSFEVEKYKLTIPHLDYLLSHFSHVKTIAGEDSVILMDGRTKQFVMLNLAERRVENVIPFSLEGPHFTDIQTSKLGWYKNKLFGLSWSLFSVYNADGKVIKRFKLDQQPSLTDYRILHFDLINNEDVLFALTPKAAIFQTRYGVGETHSIFAIWNWKNEELKLLPVSSPKEALVDDSAQGYYNQFASHQAFFVDGNIIYQFPFSSNIYEYDPSLNKVKVHFIESEFSKPLRTPTPVGANQVKEIIAYRRKVVEPYYSDLMFDKYTGWFARVHGQYKLKPDGSSEYNKFLMVFNQDYKLLYEEKIKDEVTDKGHIFNKGKVYLMLPNTNKENAYHFTVYDFNQ